MSGKPKIITNAINTNFIFSINDLNAIVNANFKSQEKYGNIAEAIIIDNSKNTVLSMLYKELSKQTNINLIFLQQRNRPQRG